MKKIVTLSESQMINMVKLILEEVDLDAYDYLDFFDAFVSQFRKWIDENVAEDTKKYPFSYLTEKYGRDFLMDVYEGEFEEFENRYGKDIDRYSVERIVKRMIQKGMFSFPSLRKKEFFTEKFKRHLDYFVKRLELPSWANLVFEEENPYEVSGVLHVDFPTSLKSSEPMPNAERIRKKLSDNLEDFLGVELGKPEFGALSFNIVRIFDGEEEWVKKVLNKKIKKDIRNLMGGRNIHAIKVHIKNDVQLELFYKADSDWSQRREFLKSVQEYLQSEGYIKVTANNN